MLVVAELSGVGVVRHGGREGHVGEFGRAGRGGTSPPAVPGVPCHPASIRLVWSVSALA